MTEMTQNFNNEFGDTFMIKNSKWTGLIQVLYPYEVKGSHMIDAAIRERYRRL